MKYIIKAPGFSAGGDAGAADNDREKTLAKTIADIFGDEEDAADQAMSGDVTDRRIVDDANKGDDDDAEGLHHNCAKYFDKRNKKIYTYISSLTNNLLDVFHNLSLEHQVLQITYLIQIRFIAMSI